MKSVFFSFCVFLTSCGAIKSGDMIALQLGGKLENLKMTDGSRVISVGKIDNTKSFEDFTNLGGKLGRAKYLYAPVIGKSADLLGKGIDKIPSN